MATKVPDNTKTRKNSSLRYIEYYDQQDILDGLYTRSINGETFNGLMPLITSEANILRAYRSIKRNQGGMTPGTDMLIHATKPETVNTYKKLLNLNDEQMKKLNNLRITAGCEPA